MGCDRMVLSKGKGKSHLERSLPRMVPVATGPFPTRSYLLLVDKHGKAQELRFLRSLRKESTHGLDNIIFEYRQA